MSDMNITLNVPLYLSNYNGKLRVVYNKKMKIITDNSFEIITDRGMPNTVANIIGYGRTKCKLARVSSPSEYASMTGDSPISYDNYLYALRRDLAVGYPNTNNLDMLFYDIEVYTYGSKKFPTAYENPILAIGYALNNGEVKILDDFNMDPEKLKYADYSIVKLFLQEIENIDPDILVSYNGYSFDMPYIITRAKLLNLDWRKLYRIYNIISKKLSKVKAVDEHKQTINKAYNEIRTMLDEFQESKFVKKYDLFGRIHYDLYEVDVLRDQLLTDLKNKKMKTLAKHCGFDDVIELEQGELSNTIKLFKENRELFTKYLDSDIRQTRSIFKRYFPINKAVAEKLQIPLNVMIGRGDGTPATLYLLQTMQRENWHVIDSNITRNKDLYLLHHKYQGAINGLRKPGKFESLHKYDFSNMYPSSMWTWNLGPDTTSIEKLTPYTGEFNFANDGITLTLEVPDTNYDRQVHIKVDLRKKSFIKKAIEELWAERNAYKKAAKESQPGTKEHEDALTGSSSVKIILNSMYGLQGNTHGIGDISVAIAITAMCRWTTTYVTDLMGDAVVAIDTDGIITDKKFDSEWLNDKIAEKIKECTGMTESRMTLDDEWADDKVQGYMYKMKNYVLQINGEKIVKHGVSMKSSSKPLIYDRAIDKLIEYTFNNQRKLSKEELVEELLDIEKLDKSYFTIRSKINKEISEYVNIETTLAGKLIKQYKDYMDVELGYGDSIEYIYINDDRSGYMEPKLVETADIKNIAIDKYKKFIYDAMKIFGIDIQESNIASFETFIEEDKKSVGIEDINLL